MNQELLFFTRNLLLKLSNSIECEMKSFIRLNLLEEINDINLELIEIVKKMNQCHYVDEYLAISMKDSIHVLEKLCKIVDKLSYEKTICKLVKFVYNYLTIHDNYILNIQGYNFLNREYFFSL